MKSRRGLASTTIATAFAAVVMTAALTVSAAVTGAVLFPTPAAAAAAQPFTLRYSGQGWMDVTQTGAAALACPAAQPGCQDGSDPSAPTAWVDVDQDPSTVNSSSAALTIPPKAEVDWVGLYWGGDRGTRGDGIPSRCDAAPDAATPPTLPPAPDKANQAKLAIAGKPYAAVTANSVSTVSGPGGGAGFQAYLDITSLVRPAAVAATPTQVSLTVAELQVASGPGCGGGWAAVLAYSYPDGPDKTYAPDFRGVTVFDGILAAPAGVRQEVRLDGIPTASQAGPQPHVASAVFSSGQVLAGNGLTLGTAPLPRTGSGVTAITGQPGPGYQLATTVLAPAAIKPGANLGATTQRDGFVAAVLGLSTPLAVKVNLSVATEVSPTTVTVGGEAVLNVTVHNDGDLKASGVKVTVRLASGLKLAAEADGYDAGTGVWSTGVVAAHASSTLSLRVTVEDPGDLVSTALITASDIPNQNPPDQQASVTVTAVPSIVPAGSTPADASVATNGSTAWPDIAPAALFGIGLFLLGLFLLSLAIVRHRARAQ